MKTLLDEGVPEILADHLLGHELTTVKLQGLKGIKNGKLLEKIKAQRFDAFITSDKRMQFAQSLKRQPFAVLLLSTNHLPTMLPHFSKIAAALSDSKPGFLTEVFCGSFIPKRFRLSAS